MLIDEAELELTRREILEDHLGRWGFETESMGTGSGLLHRLLKTPSLRVLLLRRLADA